MLALTRYVGERVLIGDDVVVQVVSVRGDRVVLGFLAPVEVAVDREEIRKQKDARERRKGGAE